MTEILELLNINLIGKYLSKNNFSYLEKIIIFDEINSTNTYLLELPAEKTNETIICFAESQTAGKGRRGKHWVSPFAQNIYLSLSWKFNNTSFSVLSGLNIAVAIALVNALKIFGIEDDIGLKWPNDILWNRKKLAGILIEICHQKNNLYRAVIGIGINVQMQKETAKNINQPWTDISAIINTTPNRNKIAGLILDQTLTALKTFEQQGIKSFFSAWQKLDVTLNKQVAIITTQQQISGISHGIDENGFFLLEIESGQIQSFAAGELSLQI